jgi:Flp pilus assembly protein TadD
MCERELGNHAAAWAAFEAAVAAEPTNVGWSRSFAESALAVGDAMTAVATTRAALARHAGDAALLGLHCEGLVRTAAWSDAEPACRLAIAASPQDPLPPKMLGVVLLETARPAEAEEALRAALALGADDAATLVNLGHSLMNQGRPADAAVPYGRAASAYPDNAYAHYVWGLALHDSGRVMDAGRRFCDAARIEPANATYREACGQ